MAEQDIQKPETKLSEVEGLKIESKGLYGAIPEELGQATDSFTEGTVQILKHHGMYQQDNRDTRTERKKAGLDKEYTMMLRTKFPGGRITAEQYLVCDDLSVKYGQNDMRATSRQDLQFHGVVKRNLRPLIHDLNYLARITTLGCCGDVVRNTMAPPVADIDPRYASCGVDLIALSEQISTAYLPATPSYFDLWLDDEKVTIREDGTVLFPADIVPAEAPEEPVYGKTYLPRKFKIALATDFDNSVDVYANDVGILAMTEQGRIVGYEFLVGGGLGSTHKKPETYPRLATPLAFVSEEEVLPLLAAVVRVQRDHGGRANRKHARLKYLIDDWGFERFRDEVFAVAGRRFASPRGVTPKDQPIYLGWSKQIQPGLNYVGVWIENGRIKDFEDGTPFKTGLRTIIERFRPSVRFTPQHNVILADIRDEDVAAVQALLDEFALPTDRNLSRLRQQEMACPALPLCPLAMAESERVMPELGKALEAAGHGDADITLRMSGCPNNCSRPRTAEIGIIGSGADRYLVYVGGDYNGTRLGELLTEKVPLASLPKIIGNLLDEWKRERSAGERFGDWCLRAGLDRLKESTARVFTPMSAREVAAAKE